MSSEILEIMHASPQKNYAQLNKKNTVLSSIYEIPPPNNPTSPSNLFIDWFDHKFICQLRDKQQIN